jgi:hypothetical protein
MGILCADHATFLHLQKLALTLPTKAADWAVYFVCGLRAKEFVFIIIIVNVYCLQLLCVIFSTIDSASLFMHYRHVIL